MQRTYGQYESGQFKLTASSDEFTVSLHWPFDRDADEWIDVSARFSRSSLEQVETSDDPIRIEEHATSLVIAAEEHGRRRIAIHGGNGAGPVRAEVYVPNSLASALLADIVRLTIKPQ